MSGIRNKITMAIGIQEECLKRAQESVEATTRRLTYLKMLRTTLLADPTLMDTLEKTIQELKNAGVDL